MVNRVKAAVCAAEDVPTDWHDWTMSRVEIRAERLVAVRRCRLCATEMQKSYGSVRRWEMVL